MRKELMTFACNPKMHAKLKLHAEKTGSAMAWHIRKAIKEYLERNSQ